MGICLKCHMAQPMTATRIPWPKSPNMIPNRRVKVMATKAVGSSSLYRGRPYMSTKYSKGRKVRALRRVTGGVWWVSPSADSMEYSMASMASSAVWNFFSSRAGIQPAKINLSLYRAAYCRTPNRVASCLYRACTCRHRFFSLAQ